MLAHRGLKLLATSCFEAHVGLFTLLMKGIFDPYVHTLDTGQKF